MPLRASDIRFETLVHVPIRGRWAIHFNVIVVSARTPIAKLTFAHSPFGRLAQSASSQPRFFSPSVF